MDILKRISPYLTRARRPQYAVGVVLLLIVAISVIVPSTLRVERATSIDASAATVFALLNDFEQINKWSPRFDIDPNARHDISGPPRGVGATMHWEGNILGAGSQTIVESVPYQRIASELNLGDGRIARSIVNLDESESGTFVAWSYEREFGMNIFARMLGLIQDDAIARDYEKGLKSLQSMAESLPRADFADLEVQQIVVEESDIAYLRATSDPLASAISEATGDAYFSILRFIDDNNLQEAGAPIIISRGFSGSKLTFDAGIPVHGVTPDTLRGSEKVKLGKSYAGPVIRVRHKGSYAYLAETHLKIAAYLAALGIDRNGDAWESYVSDPTRTVESDLITYVYYPIRP
jgi:effector-binding domain-containing protein